MPFSSGRQIRIGTLASGHNGFPLGLARHGGQSGHVAFPIEIVHRVANHKDVIFKTIYLHIKNADFALAFDDFGPDMGMEFTISLNEFRVVDEF